MKIRVVWNYSGQIVSFSKRIHTQWRPSAILSRKFTVLDKGKPSLGQAPDQNIIPWLFHAATRRFSTRTVHIFLFLAKLQKFPICRPRFRLRRPWTSFAQPELSHFWPKRQTQQILFCSQLRRDCETWLWNVTVESKEWMSKSDQVGETWLFRSFYVSASMYSFCILWN